MRQYAHWVTALTIELNALFAYIYLADFQGNMQNIELLSDTIEWIMDFKCMILHNRIQETEPMKKFRTYRAIAHLFKSRSKNPHNVENYGKPFDAKIANAMINKVIMRLKQLLDYAIHNCHTFESRPHMCQTFYFIQNIMATTYTVMRNEYLPLQTRSDIRKQLTILHFRMAQISDLLKVGRLCMINPVLINCPEWKDAPSNK
jgi:hypothetical protein